MSKTKSVSSIYYHPIVEFEDNKGKTVQIFSEDGNTHSPVYPIGTKINLLVNPNDNTRILFDTATDKWQVPLICVSTGVIGLILILGYVILFVPTEPILIQRPSIVYLNHDTMIKSYGPESTFQQLPQGVRDTLLSIIKSTK